MLRSVQVWSSSGGRRLQWLRMTKNVSGPVSRLPAMTLVRQRCLRPLDGAKLGSFMSARHPASPRVN